MRVIWQKAIMQREIESDGRLTPLVPNRCSEQPINQKLWKAWQDEICDELSEVLERLEAFELTLPAFHVESAIAAVRNAKP